MFGFDKKIKWSKVVMFNFFKLWFAYYVYRYKLHKVGKFVMCETFLKTFLNSNNILALGWNKYNMYFCKYDAIS